MASGTSKGKSQSDALQNGPRLKRRRRRNGNLPRGVVLRGAESWGNDPSPG
jgi:hypothetical protein